MYEHLRHRAATAAVLLAVSSSMGCGAGVTTNDEPARAAGSSPPAGHDFTSLPASQWRPQVHDLALAGPQDAPPLRQQRAFGGPRDDMAYDIWPAGDGGYLITGSTANEAPGDLDLVVLKLDRFGNVAWGWRIGGPRLEIGFAVRTLSDATVVVAGWTHSVGAGAGDFLLLGFARDGSPLFRHTFGGAGEERATALLTFADDTIALFGESYSHGAGDGRFYLVRTDARGNLLWERTYDSGPLHDRGLALIEHGDGLLLAGNSMDARSGSRATVSDGYAVHVDGRGEEVWARHYGGDAHDIVHHVAPLSDGEALLSGYTRGHGASGENDIWLVRIDRDGRELDNRVLGGAAADHNIVARRVAEGVLLAGYTRSAPHGGWDAELVLLDDGLQTRFDHAWGGAGDDGATAAIAEPDGAYAITGYTASGGAGGNDILLLRTAARHAPRSISGRP